MSNIIPKQAFAQLLANDHPLIDVRAPVEFNKGAFPSSHNCPLMVDSERQKVGTCYKKQGQQAAIELGHRLVSGKIKQQRIDAWLSHISAQSNSYLYCFRGGLRSQLSQQWIKDSQIDIAFIEGGYKAMRQFLIEVIAKPTKQPFYVLSGATGCGKTDFIQQRADAIDLEAIAHHRGSSFGRRHEAQPSQINFENQLAVDLLKHARRQEACLVVEDESFLIGRSAIPQPFYQRMLQAELLILEENEAARLSRLLDEYVHKMHQGFVSRQGEEAGFEAFSQYLQQSIHSIKKRLGGLQHDQLITLINQALQTQQQNGDTQAHLTWIQILLTQYYDPMYQYQLEKKQRPIKFQGDQHAIGQWLDEQQSQQ
ncbi:tRNA 2-selenouridine(34) synthase MnmH [Shewanella sp. Scap07]|uniref:tRNA 2-selenouridine(34) synthase MnmH n=1 Tax=Shewanella sp. Scap07 TaxID=2589987 RepID=UPI0021172CE5|nr:tRNA 2-selenouridine(34) synthase MnmH [Shewanella sp. Scap07]